MRTSVFDKLIWCTIGPKSFLFGTVQFSLWASGTVNYDYIVTNRINTLLIAQDVFPMAHTLSQFGPCFIMYQKLWYVRTHMQNTLYVLIHIHVHTFLYIHYTYLHK